MPQATARKRHPAPIFLLLCSFFLLCGCTIRHPDAEGALTIKVDETLNRFRQTVSGGDAFLKKSVGVLVFPAIVEAGIYVGGEYGEGALLVDGEIVDYYANAGASLGLQLGAQRKSLVMTFLTEEALHIFRNSEGWKAGVDGSVALLEWGVGGDVNTMDFQSPVVGFIFDNQGLMYNLSLEGTKFTRLPK